MEVGRTPFGHSHGTPSIAGGTQAAATSRVGVLASVPPGLGPSVERIAYQFGRDAGSETCPFSHLDALSVSGENTGYAACGPVLSDPHSPLSKMQNAAEISVRAERADQGWLDIGDTIETAPWRGLRRRAASAQLTSAAMAVIGGVLLAAMTRFLGAISSNMAMAATLGIAVVAGTVAWKSMGRGPARREAVDRTPPSRTRFIQSACSYVAFLLLLILPELSVSGEPDRPLVWSAIAGLFVLIGLSLLMLRERLQALFLRKTVVIIGNKERARRIAKWLVAIDPHSVVVGRFQPAELDNFTRGARVGRCSHVVLALNAGEHAKIPALLKRLAPLALDVRDGVAAIGGGGYALVRLQGPALDRKQHILKSALDLIVAVSALIVLAPVMALIALAVKIDSPGPVIFVQPRGGYRGRTFDLFKFRTMSVMEKGDDVVQARADDPRITTVGAFLRRTSLDELPQLFNILRGEISLVGPRPHALAHDRYYGDLFEQYSLRQRMKPGITGWAQVSGYRGETRDPEKMRCRVEHDLMYIKNWSLWLDIKILVRTLAITLWDRKAF